MNISKFRAEKFHVHQSQSRINEKLNDFPLDYITESFQKSELKN